MVKEINYLGVEHYYCEDCELVYETINWAEKCEGWCKENNSCNVEITSHSIKKTLEDLTKNDR